MITQTINQNRRMQRGITMIDMLVAMAVSLLLLVGLLQAYLDTKQVYRVEESTARLMENGSVAMELVSRAVRLGGYWGCSGLEASTLKNHLGTNQRGLHGTDGTSDAPDTLRLLQIVDGTATAILAGVTLPATIDVATGHGLQAGDLVVANDCSKGDIFQLTSVDDTVTPETLTPGCTTCIDSYGTDASITRVRDAQFYIDTGAGGQPALFQNADGTAREIVEGVEDMQVYYGEDTDGDGVLNRYVTTATIDALCASNPDCWLRVVSVRVSLLLRTLDDNITLTPQTYTYNGTTVTATDNRLRRIYTTVISTRNHYI